MWRCRNLLVSRAPEACARSWICGTNLFRSPKWFAVSTTAWSVFYGISTAMGAREWKIQESRVQFGPNRSIFLASSSRSSQPLPEERVFAWLLEADASWILDVARWLEVEATYTRKALRWHDWPPDRSSTRYQCAFKLSRSEGRKARSLQVLDRLPKNDLAPHRQACGACASRRCANGSWETQHDLQFQGKWLQRLHHARRAARHSIVIIPRLQLWRPGQIPSRIVALQADGCNVGCGKMVVGWCATWSGSCGYDTWLRNP